MEDTVKVKDWRGSRFQAGQVTLGMPLNDLSRLAELVAGQIWRSEERSSLENTLRSFSICMVSPSMEADAIIK